MTDETRETLGLMLTNNIVVLDTYPQGHPGRLAYEAIVAALRDVLTPPPPALDMNEAAEHFRKGWEAGNAAATSDQWRAGRGEIHTCPTCGPECAC